MDESALETQKLANVKCTQKGYLCPLNRVFHFPIDQIIDKEPNYGQRNNKITQKQKKYIDYKPKCYQLKTTIKFWQKELQNLTSFTSNGQTKYLEARVILSLTESAPIHLVPSLASFKHKSHVKEC